MRQAMTQTGGRRRQFGRAVTIMTLIAGVCGTPAAWAADYYWDGTTGNFEDTGPWGGVVPGVADNAKTVSWTLDGKVMDTADITGCFDSSPDCVRQGAYASIVGGGSYRENVWKIADVRIETAE